MYIDYFDTSILVSDLKKIIKGQAVNVIEMRVGKDVIDETFVERVVREIMCDFPVAQETALAVICHYGMTFDLLRGEPTDDTPWGYLMEDVIQYVEDELDNMGIEVLPAQ